MKQNNYSIAIVVAPFYKEICEGLMHGATQYWNGLSTMNCTLTTVEVPGALEIPLAIQLLAKTQHYHAAVALGAVIRGETAHFDHVCTQSANGITRVGLDFDFPVGNGIITVEDFAQAKARSGDNEKNKGFEAARAAHELLQLKLKLSN